MTKSTLTEKQAGFPILQRLAEFGNRLIEPGGAVHPSDYLHMRLLAFLLASLISLGVAALVLTVLDPHHPRGRATASMLILVVVLLLGIAYVLIQTKFYRFASTLTVGVVIGAVLISAWLQAEPANVGFLGVGILLSSIFLSWRRTLFWMMTALFGIAFLSLFEPSMPLGLIVEHLFFALTIGTIALLYANIQQRYMRVIEQRSFDLAKSETALRQARDNLELRVQERTLELAEANLQMQAEVVAREQAESAMRESEEKYRRLVNEAIDGFFVVDPSGTITFANLALARIHGFEHPSELIGHKFFEFVVPDEADDLRKGFEAALNSPQVPAAIELDCVRKDGAILSLEIRPVNIYQDGAVVGSQGIIRDITQRKQAEVTLQQVNQRLQDSIVELEGRNREAKLLAEMGDLFQACKTFDEATGAIRYILPQLFPGSAGTLYVYSPSHDDLESILSWGRSPGELTQRMFEPENCWALRRGLPHKTKDLCAAPPCQNVAVTDQFLCVPMVAQAEMLGVLHLSAGKADSPMDKGAPINEQLAVRCAEHIAMALVNLRLRETLRNQSIHDPLTGLYNRRVMEAELSRELRRAERIHRPMSVIMLDLDRFKTFNDTFGHEAGDMLLRELSAYLLASIRGGDVVCRFGGEEFVLILPDTSLKEAHSRAETIREGISAMTVVFHGQALGPVTASLGIATYPVHGTTAEALLRVADGAMYQAKSEGRNRVVAAASP